VVDRLSPPPGPDDDFDFSTPEAEAAIRAANALVLDVTRPLADSVALYEKTLGLAVVPVLLRRKIIHWMRRRRQTGP
jgi:hypothetical protein